MIMFRHHRLPVLIGGVSSVPCPLPARFASTAGLRRCCFWPKGTRSVKPHGAYEYSAPLYSAGRHATSATAISRRSPIGLATGGLGLPERSRPGGWPPPFNRIPVPAALGQRAGPCPCSPAICASTATSLSARAPCDGGCMRAASAGSVRAMSIADGRRIWGRKKGATPPAASPSQAARYRALCRLDALEALSAAACGLGARG